MKILADAVEWLTKREAYRREEATEALAQADVLQQQAAWMRRVVYDAERDMFITPDGEVSGAAVGKTNSTWPLVNLWYKAREREQKA